MYKTKIKIRKIVKISQVDMSDIVSGADLLIFFTTVVSSGLGNCGTWQNFCYFFHLFKGTARFSDFFIP